MLDTLTQYRKLMLIMIVLGIALHFAVIIQSSEIEKGIQWKLMFIGTAALANVPLFLFILTEAFGPVAKTRSSANKLLARIFVLPFGLVSLFFVYVFLQTLVYSVIQ